MFISKSKYLVGLQCPKLLWIHYNAKNLLPRIDPQTQAIFDEGHRIGELAKQLFPDGIDLDYEQDFNKVPELSKKTLEKRKPIFEAGFLSKNTYARADILNPVENDETSQPTFDWDIIEVKSSTKVKPINYHDLALQKYCYENAGVKIRDSWILHLSYRFLNQEKATLKQKFELVNVTEKVKVYEEGIERRISEMLKIIDQLEPPKIKPNKNCHYPYECVMKTKCWDI